MSRRTRVVEAFIFLPYTYNSIKNFSYIVRKKLEGYIFREKKNPGSIQNTELWDGCIQDLLSVDGKSCFSGVFGSWRMLINQRKVQRLVKRLKMGTSQESPRAQSVELTKPGLRVQISRILQYPSQRLLPFLTPVSPPADASP